MTLPVLVMAAPQHAPAVHAYLRPLLAELGATVLMSGLAVLEADLDELDGVLEPWAERVAGALGARLLAGAPAPAHAV
jgi:FMN reductase